MHTPPITRQGRKLFSAFAVVTGVFSAFLPLHFAEAASLYFYPSVSTVAVGNIVTLNVMVNSEGEAINNSETSIQFPTDLLQVISVSKSSSIFSLWVEDPNFSNTTGQVSFNGGITNPGYTGSGGQLISITFRAKKVGTASILFSDASVFANDGLGTEVLSGKSSATLTITSQVTTPPSGQVPSSILSISSPTHPDQNAWYTSKDAVVLWTLPSQAKTLQTSLDTVPHGVPHVSYTPAISRKEIKQLDDGVSYFHVRYMTATGWSAVSDYRFQIDTTPPKDLVVDTMTDKYGQVIVHMSADDSLSGIGHYALQIDRGQATIVLPDATTGAATSTLPALSGTDHVILVRAYDRAGNMIEVTRAFNPSVPSAINITSYPTSVRVGQRIVIVGQASYPHATVSVALTTDGKSIDLHNVEADENGVFRFESDPMTTSGITILWADLLNQNGDTIASSGKVSIAVQKPILIQIGSYSAELLSVLIPLLALLLLLLILIYIGWHKFFGVRRRIRKDLEQARIRVHQAFTALSKEASEELSAIEKSAKRRKLSPAEEESIAELRDTIEHMDTYIQKIVQQIEDSDL